MKKRTVFFDRDGTLIIDKVYLNDPEQIEYLPDVFKALGALRDADYQFVVVTNQSGVARGIVDIANLDEIHRRMTVRFAEHGIRFLGYYYAPYSVESKHFLRKPNPGMLLQAASEHHCDLASSWMVGDRLSDVEAGARAGTRTVLLTSSESITPELEFKPDLVVDGLWAAAEEILRAGARR